ncbi:MAG: hypothetical protein KAQ89_01660 [Planctomycetes bacterium]|nr:hypothetical protein [Planctomycetota bacterium]
MRDFYTALFGVVLCVLVVLPFGCTVAQPGETKAEGRRRHIRNSDICHVEMIQDIDKAMLWDKPSKLSDKKIPD